MKGENDSKLVSLYLDGNEEALKELVSRYLTPIYNFSYRLSGNKDEANDITQDTFIKIWKNLKKYKPEKKFSTWIFTIAKNTTFDWLRKRKSDLFSNIKINDNEDSDEYEKNIPDTELLQHEIFEKDEMKRQVEEALDILSIEEKTVVILHNSEEMSFEEISLLVKKPMNTTKSQYRRSLIKMKTYLSSKKK